MDVIEKSVRRYVPTEIADALMQAIHEDKRAAFYHGFADGGQRIMSIFNNTSAPTIVEAWENYNARN